MSIVCFTSLTLGYLPRARVLAETLRAAHPDWRLWAVLVDRVTSAFDHRDLFACFDRVLDAEDLGIPRFRAWLFRHDLIEACTAVKGAMLLYLQAQGAEKIVYFDPDIAVFHPLAALENLLDGASVVLTPHQVAPNDSPIAISDNELASMRYGIYNLGFLGVRSDDVGRAFAAWWAARLHEACFDDPASGLFTDQKYGDLVPALFDRVAITRDPGWNVASWNLSRRRLRFTDSGGLTANGSPLAFYHFTKHGGVGDVMTERYARRLPRTARVVAMVRAATASIRRAGHQQRAVALYRVQRRHADHQSRTPIFSRTAGPRAVLRRPVRCRGRQPEILAGASCTRNAGQPG